MGFISSLVYFVAPPLIHYLVKFSYFGPITASSDRLYFYSIFNKLLFILNLGLVTWLFIPRGLLWLLFSHIYG